MTKHPHFCDQRYGCDICGRPDKPVEIIDAFKQGHAAAMSEIERLKKILSLYKVHGTDACGNYDCRDGGNGRITIFKANDLCIHCDPKGYEAIK